MLYPTLDPLYCELDEGDFKCNPSCLEKNFSQIIDKTPALTKELINKVNSEIVPEKTSVCGKNLKTRRLICEYSFFASKKVCTKRYINMYY